ncbi:MAG: hypothetical protein IPI68_02890 [Chitinophagaceae bacterium]|nr:hypothetical protein [Chitinophagaceae bacterium]
MKKIIVFTILLITANATFSQPSNVSSTLTKQDYLQKSKHQKTAAWILMGGGATLLLTGIVIPKGALTHSGFLDDTYKNDGIKDAFDLTGIVSMLGSIPFFIASSKNKKKAASLSFKNEPIPKLQKNSFVYRTIPALTLKIYL